MTHKRSIYSSFLTLENGYGIAYNSITDTFVMLPKGYVAHEVIEIYDNSPVLLKQLSQAGIYIKEDVNEVETLKQRVYEVDNNKELFQLHINPTLNCNFNCWYCYENHITESKLSKTLAKSILHLIGKILEENKELKVFNLSFFGGEPLLYFNECTKPLIDDFYSLLDGTDVKPSLHFTTNGYLLKGEVAKYLFAKKASFQITLDGAKRYHNATRTPKDGSGSYDSILESVINAASVGCFITLRINFTKENANSITEIFSDLSSFPKEIRQFVDIDLQQVWQDRGKDEEEDGLTDLTVRLIELGKSMGFRVHSSLRRLMPFESCYGDKQNHLLINYDGKVFRCTARDFTSENSHGVLKPDGSIKWTDSKNDNWMKLKLSRPICLKCRIAPLCAGGCRQKAWEMRDEEGCLYHYTEKKIDNIILERFEAAIIDAC